jgi:UDP-glucose 4-epimerase
LGSDQNLTFFSLGWDIIDGAAVRDFIHESDLARGQAAVLDTATRVNSPKGFLAINLSTGNGQTVKEVVVAMEHVIGREILKRMTGRREGDVGVCIAETSTATRILVWKA